MNEQVVAIARQWLGTPYVHQASRRGAGADCLGLIRGIWRSLYGAEPEVHRPYTPDWGEFGVREHLLDGALRHLVALGPNDSPKPGEVLLFRMRQGAVAKHLGILSQVDGGGHFIHAYQRHGVVESPLSAPWKARIAARFRFP